MFTFSLGETKRGPPRTWRGTMVRAATLAVVGPRNLRRGNWGLGFGFVLICQTCLGRILLKADAGERLKTGARRTADFAHGRGWKKLTWLFAGAITQRNKLVACSNQGDSLEACSTADAQTLKRKCRTSPSWTT